MFVADYEKYSKRARNFENLFDPSTGFMRPKRNGGFIQPFAPNEVTFHFTEGNSWVYSFFVPHDVIRLSARRDGDGVAVEVADSGPGIPAGDRDRVFDRFFHRHPSGTEPGTGLGLALVYSVARAHGGRASAGEAPEGGALLTLHLPVATNGGMLTPTLGLIPQQVRTAGASLP